MNPRAARLLAPLFGWSLLCGLLAGCAGYRVGPVNGASANSRSVEVRLFRNDTYEPRVSEAVAFALRRRFQQDGTYRLDTQNEGDILLNGTVTRLERSALSFQPSDVLTTRDYYIVLYADVTATERSSGKILFAGTLSGQATVRAVADLGAADRQAVPQLAQDLAKRIVSALAEGPW